MVCREYSLEKQWFVMEGGANLMNYEEQMLLHNRLDGLLSMEVHLHNGEKRYRYDITDCESLEEHLDGKKISGGLIQQLFETISRVITEAKGYTLTEEGFLLAPELIWIHRGTGSIFLCYHPETRTDFREQMRLLSSWILERVDSSDDAGVFSGYSIYVLSRDDNLKFSSICEVFGKAEYKEALEKGRKSECGEDDAGTECRGNTAHESEPENDSETDLEGGEEMDSDAKKQLSSSSFKRFLSTGAGKLVGEVLVLGTIIGIFMYMIP